MPAEQLLGARAIYHPRPVMPRHRFVRPCPQTTATKVNGLLRSEVRCSETLNLGVETVLIIEKVLSARRLWKEASSGAT